ncbi:hypothetical protein FGK63_16535 [Ruegeria sediminis]|uniref:Uncharacterized protein n=1 Tax=Ruegeria sediminis TaxID=2583820 RepID=A0ABY2WUE5_9RHOB|nr:hypothetical protein [Ruegeria sediminis]TMV05648.1 hypothetical protein FGK63_16535 [Ruegeria sediminis]
MNNADQAASRPRESCARSPEKAHRLASAIAAVVLALGIGGTGQVSAENTSPAPHVVGNDRGGSIKARLFQIRRLRASGQRVEIRGKFCFSTCTMLLGLPNTCILPETQFGFHGPSLNGRRLAPDRFEYFSRVISQYYPQPLRDWYMKTGRNRLNPIYRISGARIIAMGIAACDA